MLVRPWGFTGVVEVAGLWLRRSQMVLFAVGFVGQCAKGATVWATVLLEVGVFQVSSLHYCGCIQRPGAGVCVGCLTDNACQVGDTCVVPQSWVAVL